MALSFVQYSGDGATTQRAVPFPYLSKTHVAVKVNNVVTAFTWITDNTVSIVPAPVGGAVIDIRRTTPVAALVNFNDASTLTEADLDLATNQLLYLIQEQQDSNDQAIRLATDGTYDALSRVIKNVADGINANDAVNRSQLTAAQLGGITPNAASITNTPSGDIGATSVQAALNELDTEKASRGGANNFTNTNTFSGNTIVAAADAPTEAAQLQQIPHKNGIVNGSLTVWQDGVTFTAVADTVYIADNLKYRKNGTMVHDVTRVNNSTSALLPGHQFNRARLTLTTAQAAMAAANFNTLSTYIEGYQWTRYKNSTFTIQFLVKLPLAGTYCFSIRNASLNYTYVGEFSYTTANTDQLITATVVAPPAGSWDTTNGLGAELAICLGAGTNHHGALGWSATSALATVNQVNSLNVATTSQYELAMLRIDPGPVALAWAAADFSLDLVLHECQRYYEKNYNYGVVPGAVDALGCVNKISLNAVDFYDFGDVRFKTPKRLTPTMVIYSTTGASGFVRESGATDRAASVTNIGETGLRVYSAAMVANSSIQFHWTASARF